MEHFIQTLLVEFPTLNRESVEEAYKRIYKTAKVFGDSDDEATTYTQQTLLTKLYGPVVEEEEEEEEQEVRKIVCMNCGRSWWYDDDDNVVKGKECGHI